MSKTKSRIANLGQRTRQTAKGLSNKDQVRETRQRLEKEALFFPLENIKNRPGGNTRSLNPEHVIFLAESIQALGLLEPVVIDNDGHLLAGGHRVAACKLLNLPDNERADFLRANSDLPEGKKGEAILAKLEILEESEESLDEIPIRKIDFNATDDFERALAIEAAENTQRRDYTSQEVLRIYNRLTASGYTDRRGKPKEGEKPAKPMIASIIGKSVRTVERMLAKAQEDKNEDAELFKALKGVERSIRKLVRVSEEYEEDDGPFFKLVHRLNNKATYRLITQIKESLTPEESPE